MTKNFTIYQDMIVYASFDRSQCGLNIAIDHGIWMNKADDFIFLEGKVPKSNDISNVEMDPGVKSLFEDMIKDKKNKYFVIISSEWSKELQSEEYINKLKESRNQ